MIIMSYGYEFISAFSMLVKWYDDAEYHNSWLCTPYRGLQSGRISIGFLKRCSWFVLLFLYKKINKIPSSSRNLSSSLSYLLHKQYFRNNTWCRYIRAAMLSPVQIIVWTYNIHLVNIMDILHRTLSIPMSSSSIHGEGLNVKLFMKTQHTGMYNLFDQGFISHCSPQYLHCMRNTKRTRWIYWDSCHLTLCVEKINV